MKITPALMIELPFYEDATSDCEVYINESSEFYKIEKNLIKFIEITKRIAYPRIEHINMRHFFDTYYKGNKIEIPLLQFYEDYYREHYKDHLEKEQKLKYGRNDKITVTNGIDTKIIKYKNFEQMSKNGFYILED